MAAFHPKLPSGFDPIADIGVSRQLGRMTRRFSIAPFFLIAGAAAVGAPSPESFANSYSLNVGVDKGQCIFFLTDTGMSAPEVTTKLMRDGYERSRGLEVLLTKDTPSRCGVAGRKAALDAGFKAVRVRLATDKDRWNRP